MASTELPDGASTNTFEAVERTNPHRTRTTTETEHLTFNETAQWLRCSTRTLQRLLETGEGPPVIRLSERRLIFRLSDLQRWLASRTHGSRSAIRTAVRRNAPQPPRRGRPRKLPAPEGTAEA
jgi:predicted DNA-binding transcriptional regulator AlpA